MTMRIQISVVVALAAAWIGAQGVLGAESGQPAAGRIAPPAVADLERRLRALDPRDAEAYFLLGEDVASEAVEPEHVELAKTLFVLAFELDRRQAAPSWVSASACLALAEVSRLERERRWLTALARTMDARQAPPDWNYADPIRISDETAYQAATAIGMLRSGHGRQARELLARPEIGAVVLRYETLLHPMGLPGETGRLTREAERWPCPECSNERVLRRPGVNPPELIPCPWCRGDPGIRLTMAEMVGQLRFESRLLAGVHRSWSAQVASDAGLPVRDPDPDELAPTLGVDASKVFWRSGRWTDQPESGQAGL
ncbi:MAG: hypothetical protein KF866_01750 [Phycisphaeraceae bacterium]|nr:hypothetical protein [Phycisphaeraceae bacterium]MCW5753583.1 hypothetical protein [Phycisphaeraceae bacterium]